MLDVEDAATIHTISARKDAATVDTPTQNGENTTGLNLRNY